MQNLTMQNQTSNITTYLPLREQLAMFGFYYLVDVLVTAFYIPSCFIGSLLSIVCVVIFCSKEFKLTMFIYLRLYSIANTVIALVSIYSALTTPVQLFSVGNSPVSNYYVAYVYCPIMNLSYFYATVLDIAMLMERIALFVPRLKPVFCDNPYKLSALVFLVCLAIDFPYFFFYLPTSVLFQLNETEYFRLYYIDYTEFGFSQAGHIVQYTQWVVRDILPVILIFLCGAVSVALLKAHMKKKHKLVKHKTGPQQKEVKNETQSQPDGGRHGGENSQSNTTAGAAQPQNQKPSSGGNKQTSRSNVRFAILVYSTSLLTTIQSIFSIIALASILLDPASIFVTIANNVFNFFLVFKCCCLFFIFYFLNTNFKKKIDSWLRLKF